MSRLCLACGQRPAATTPEWPALCESCLTRVGDRRLAPGDRVICEVDNGCNGSVDRLEDDGQMVVVRTEDGQEAWVPIQEMVRVIG